jgi:hypothetical protein
MKLNKASEDKVDPIFAAMLRVAELPQPKPEHRFSSERRFRFDYAWIDRCVALEVEGGIYGGRRCPVCKRPSARGHSSITGIKRDIEKYNLATVLGWRVIRCLSTEFHSDKTIEILKKVLTDAEEAHVDTVRIYSR